MKSLIWVLGLCGVATGLALAADPPAPGPATKPAFLSLTTQPITTTLAEACALTMQGDQLVLNAAPPATVLTGVPATIAGLPGTSKIVHRPLVFRIENMHETADGRPVKLWIERRDNYVNIQRTVGQGEALEHVGFVQAYQDDRAAGLKAGQVLLTVRHGARAGDTDVMCFVCEGLGGLRREYPVVYAECVAPMFREMGALSTLSIDPAVAMQIVGEATPDEKTRARVLELVGQLDADESAKREAALRDLLAPGKAAASVVAGIDKDTLSAQQRTSIAEVVANRALVEPDDVARLRKDADFLLDCLYCDSEPVCSGVTALLSKLTGKGVEFDAKLTGEKRREAIEGLRQRLLAKGK